MHGEDRLRVGFNDLFICPAFFAQGLCPQLRGNVAGVDLFAAYSNERVYIAFGSQKITLRASDTLDAARTVAGYLGVQIPDISLDSAGMAALTKNVTMQETANGMNIRLNDPMFSGTVQLTDPDALRLTRADVSLNLGGARMRIAATPYYGGFRVQPLDGYTDLTGALSLVSPLMDAATARTATFDVALSGPMRLSGTATGARAAGTGWGRQCAVFSRVQRFFSAWMSTLPVWAGGTGKNPLVLPVVTQAINCACQRPLPVPPSAPSRESSPRGSRSGTSQSTFCRGTSASTPGPTGVCSARILSFSRRASALAAARKASRSVSMAS